MHDGVGLARLFSTGRELHRQVVGMWGGARGSRLGRPDRESATEYTGFSGL